jgi:cytochrome b pre-mRNA-processing protein 3
MVFSWFRRNPHAETVDALYMRLVEAARMPALYLPPYNAPDRIEGRFDLLALHLFLLTRRLAQLPAPAPDIAQAITDRAFAGIDAALREGGIGDLSVPKRMKKLGNDYNGRALAYEAALAADDEAELLTALARNVYASADCAIARPLAAFTRAAAADFAASDLAALTGRTQLFPDPQQFGR